MSAALDRQAAVIDEKVKAISAKQAEANARSYAAALAQERAIQRRAHPLARVLAWLAR
jgi:hypothetical protein